MGIFYLNEYRKVRLKFRKRTETKCVGSRCSLRELLIPKKRPITFYLISDIWKHDRHNSSRRRNCKLLQQSNKDKIWLGAYLLNSTSIGKLPLTFMRCCERKITKAWKSKTNVRTRDEVIVMARCTVGACITVKLIYVTNAAENGSFSTWKILLAFSIPTVLVYFNHEVLNQRMNEICNYEQENKRCFLSFQW